jgi:general stress protein 26
MPQPEPTVELHEGFSQPGIAPRPWADVEEVLSNCEMFWLSTVRGDGRPHVAPLPAVWLDGMLHFCTGAHEQKAKNLRSDPHCILAGGANQFGSGLDVVVEGTATRVTDLVQLQRLVSTWKSRPSWDFQDSNAFSDPTGTTALVFGVKPDKILAFSKNPYTQSRYRFTT